MLLRDAATSQTLAVSTAATIHVNLPAQCASAVNVAPCPLGKTGDPDNPSPGPAPGAAKAL